MTGPPVTLELLAELLEEARSELAALRTQLEGGGGRELVSGCSPGPIFASSASSAAPSMRSSLLSRSSDSRAMHDR